MKKLTGTLITVGLIAALAVALCAGFQYGVLFGVATLGIMSLPLAPGAQIAFGAGPQLRTPVDKKAFLKEMKMRSRVLQPSTAERVTGVLGQLEESLKDENVQKSRDKMKDIYDRIKAGGREAVEAKAELAQMRVITVDNFILASTNPVAFFDTQNLENNEIPYIENTTSQEIVVSYLGQDGRARKTQPIRRQGFAQVDLHELSTEEYEYVLRDIYKGVVRDSQLANVDLARDLNLQISKKMWPFIFAAIGNFTVTGPPAKRTYFPHSIVDTDNLPTTNLLVPTGNTTTSKLRKECLDLILSYGASWGDTLGGGAMKPVAVYVPSAHVMGWLDSVTLTSFGNSKVEEIFETGFVLSYGGATWTFIGDATLSPKKGRAYVKYNKPIGVYFTKSGMDQTFEDESINMQKQNKGSVSMNKVVGWGLPLQWFVNVAAVQYKTDET